MLPVSTCSLFVRFAFSGLPLCPVTVLWRRILIYRLLHSDLVFVVHMYVRSLIGANYEPKRSRKAKNTHTLCSVNKILVYFVSSKDWSAARNSKARVHFTSLAVMPGSNAS